MTGVLTLDWAIMAVSLFDTVVLLWLGVTVLLNAERRSWGVWLAGGGLLIGAAFFVSHSAILGHGVDHVSQSMDFWWRVGWPPVVAAPFAWYVIMLWYAGYWDPGGTDLRTRQRIWFGMGVGLFLILIGLLLLANPIPSFLQVARLDLGTALSIGGVPLLIVLYPVYIVMCILLSLDALRRPGPSLRMMGDLARRRARPWLIAASLALLLVSLMVAWIMVWIALRARSHTFDGLYTGVALTVAWFDLVIAGLIGLAVVLLGQAIVSYEVFTGKTLPRRGLFRHWRSAVILAGGYGVVIGWSLVAGLRPIYALLLSAVLMVLFFALSSWRSYVERERFIDSLRPFVSSQRLYDSLLATAPMEVDLAAPFATLCAKVLETEVAHLVALGPLAPLVGPPLTYPDGAARNLEPSALTDLAAHFESPHTVCVSVDAGTFAGAIWAVPLWSERGVIGVLLLGPKRDGGLYAQEELQIARASGERLIDTRGSAEVARRLMELQRKRLAEGQVADRRARRAMHDDILPQLHTAVLLLNAGQSSPEVVALLAEVHGQISDLLIEMPAVTVPEAMRDGLAEAVLQIVLGELRAAFDAVDISVEPEVERELERIPALVSEVLFYAVREAVRNAARHGREEGETFGLQVSMRWRDGLVVEVEDDGVGFKVGDVKNEDSGQGLALHSTMMAVVGGTLSVGSVPGVGTRVSIALPQEVLQQPEP